MTSSTAILNFFASPQRASREPDGALLAYLMVAGGVCVLVYGLLFWSLGFTVPALIELSYAALILASYGWLKTRGGPVRAFVWIHIACVLCVVFGVTVAMGGLSSSGWFMVWGVISPLAAMVFLGLRQAISVSVAFAAMSVAGDLVTIPEAYRESFPPQRVGWIAASNIVGSMALVLVTLGHFLKRLRKAEQVREQLRIQELKVQKLDSLGTLAGGIAHDFNNLLMALSGNVANSPRTFRGHP